jgi:hypothetical protein
MVDHKSSFGHKNGDALLVGEVNGCDLTAGTIQTGAGLGDLYGYSITMTGEEVSSSSIP